MHVPCKQVQLLDRDPDRNLDCNPDGDLDDFAPCKRGIICQIYATDNCEN